MARYLVAYLAAAAVMVALDLAWLTLVMKHIFEASVGSLLAPKTGLGATLLFYLLYVAGLLVFAVSPALRSGHWVTALLFGAGFGFFAYMTYDLTNMATLKVWPVHLAALDIVWGTLVTGAAATAGYLAASRMS
ncbi:MAG: DUF2177 family protein [Rhizomicrobium sp.]